MSVITMVQSCIGVPTLIHRVVISYYLDMIAAAKSAIDHLSSLDTKYVAPPSTLICDLESDPQDANVTHYPRAGTHARRLSSHLSTW